MKSKLIRSFLISAVISAIVMLPTAQADDNNYYNFDYEDYWKEYKEWGYPAATRLPCNGGGSETACTWAWKPWYEHGTDIPQFFAEKWSGRTVSGYGLAMRWYGGGKNIHGGVFRQENVQPCHTYRFTMYARSGLEYPGYPASTNARMQIGISPTGDYPDQIVLNSTRINAITWSAQSNSQYAYENLAVQAKAQGSTITLFTRADPDPNNEPYTFWDEGTFSEVAHTANLVDASQPLPAPTSGINNIDTTASAANAWVSWDTASVSTLGQVLYRPVGSTQIISPTTPLTPSVYLPLVLGGGITGQWQYSVLDTWKTGHTIQLTGLSSKTIYEYVVVSYGYINGTCNTIVSETAQPRQFETP